MKKPLTFLLTVILTFTCLSGSSFGFKDGLRMEEDRLRLSAEQGNASAQYILGFSYFIGQGVPQDYKETVRLYRLSAEQGEASAQYNLGVMYYQGQGVAQDYVLAHMWWNLSGSQGITDAIKGRNIAEKKMSKQQIEKAQEMARNWKPTSK